MSDKFPIKVTPDGFMWQIVSKAEAKRLFKADKETYRLYDDDSEGLVETLSDIDNHVGQIGVELGFVKCDETSIANLTKKKAKPEIAIICYGGMVQGVRANFDAGVEVIDIDDMETLGMSRDKAFEKMEKQTKHLNHYIR